MMKNKIARYIVNGVALAALAAVGITAFQLGTSPSKEEIQEEILVENVGEEDLWEEEDALVDAGTSQVEASMEEAVEMETVTEPEETVELENQADLEESLDLAEQTDVADVLNSVSETTDLETTNVSAQVADLMSLNFSEETFMEWPVNGNILLDYSMDQTTYFPTLDQYKLSSAIAVQAVEGAPVMATADGKVFSITQDAWTGTTVTMELGNGYQAIYGQLKDLAVQEGDMVEKGTIIGYINAPTKYYSSEGSNLYYAMKKNGEPIDPILYLP